MTARIIQSTVKSTARRKQSPSTKRITEGIFSTLFSGKKYIVVNMSTSNPPTIAARSFHLPTGVATAFVKFPKLKKSAPAK